MSHSTSTSTKNQHSSNPTRQSTADAADDNDSDEALFEALENEDDSVYRTHRIEQLNAEFAKEANAKPQHDRDFSSAKLDTDTAYPTLSNDQSLLDFTTQTHRCVIHFAHPDFARCGVMDKHLRELAARHYEVRFARVDVREIPFVVNKLNIRVLPCVVGFKDGVAVERVVGFEGLGSRGLDDGVDQISSVILERRLLRKDVLIRAKFTAADEDGGTSAEESDGEDDSRRYRSIRQGPARPNASTGDDDGDNDDGDNDDDWD